MSVTAPGVYDLPFSVYLADPCPGPSASSGILGTLLERTPRHAWHEHPRLNPKHERRHATQFDIGTAAHALLLEGDAGVTVIDADSYRTKPAQNARDAAYAADSTPLLPDQLADVEAMVRACRHQLAHHQEAKLAFMGMVGTAEQTLIWQEGKLWCRARPDWTQSGAHIIYDYKTLGNAHPDAATRHLYGIGADLQDAFYSRGYRKLKGQRPRFRFVCQEPKPPYCLSVVEFSPAARDMAERKVETALDLWGWCLERDEWPGYPSQIATVDPPVWTENRWLERETRAQTYGGERKLLETAMNWQAPLEATP